MTLIYFIIVLGITVLIHEFGHFIFAKKAGVYVYEFSIGMGPQIFHFKRKNDETVYSIRLFPIGGFVSMAGEDMEADNDIPKDKQLCSKSWGKRFLTISAGVLFNFLLAIVLLFAVGLVTGNQKGNPYISSLANNSPAMEKLVVGDEIIGINGINTKNTDRITLELTASHEATLNVLHQDGSKEEIDIAAKKIEKDGDTTYSYGFSLGVDKEYGIIAAIKYSVGKTFSLLCQMVLIIKYLCIGKLSLNSLSGPVGIFNIVGESARAGFINIIYLIAYLCINVGFLNFIPLPAFDGGRLLFMIIEKIKGSKVNPKIENTIHSIGFLLLMVLMVFITYNDIMRLFK